VSPSEIEKDKNMVQALMDHAWVEDIRGALNLVGLTEYVQLWDALADIVLNT
jgi:hypothetical protein